MRNGILASGNFIMDVVKIINAYPEQDSLSNILEEYQSNGGSPYNILKDLYKLGAPFPLEACGLVGADEKGNFIISDCKKHHIRTDLLFQTSKKPTSYTDVMTVKSTGRRTFFHNRGANSLFQKEHIQLEKSNAKIFTLAYLMLLDTLDLVQANGRTQASEIFEKAKKMGFITASDLVSENSDTFAATVASSFPYLDVLFVNEFEAEKITGIKTRINSAICKEACVKAAQTIIKMGVLQYVIVHFPAGCLAVSSSGSIFEQPALNIPAQYIKGSVGAGDAFAAGVLYALHEQKPIEYALLLGVCSAASCLFDASCSMGILPEKECIHLSETFGFQ